MFVEVVEDQPDVLVHAGDRPDRSPTWSTPRARGSSISHLALVAEPFTAWRLSHGLTGADMTEDSDGDGVPDGIEFVVGGVPGTDSRPLLPVMIPDEENDGFHFVFRRTSESAGYAVEVELSEDLEKWHPAANLVPAVETLVDEDFHGPGIDRVSVRVPETPQTDRRLFGRLAVGAP